MTITIEAQTPVPPERTFQAWTSPDDIKHWNAGKSGPETTEAEVELRVGGRFESRSVSSQGASGITFGGSFTRIEAPTRLEYRTDDGRAVTLDFEAGPSGGTHIRETFETDPALDETAQRTAWLAVLNAFVAHLARHPDQPPSNSPNT